MKRFFAVLVLALTLGTSSASAHDLKWDDLMLASVKLNQHFDYEENVDSYMQIYMPDVWNRVKNDEFELNDKRAEVVKIMKDNVAAFSLEEDFVFLAAIQFQDYDFEKGVFPVVKMDPGMYFAHPNTRHGSFPYEYKVFFSNPQFFQDIKMSKDDAKSFVQSRKASNGSVNRMLVTEIRFRVTKNRDARGEIEAEIVRVTTFKDKERTMVLQEY